MSFINILPSMKISCGSYPGTFPAAVALVQASLSLFASSLHFSTSLLSSLSSSVQPGHSCAQPPTEGQKDPLQWIWKCPHH